MILVVILNKEEDDKWGIYFGYGKERLCVFLCYRLEDWLGFLNVEGFLFFFELRGWFCLVEGEDVRRIEEGGRIVREGW